jgi:hypothetical protein
MLNESTMNEEEGRAMKETEPNMKGLLDVIYLIVCEYCGRVKWCNKWVHFSEVDKKDLRKRKVNWKVVTCKDCEAKHAAVADGHPNNSIIDTTMIQAALDCGLCRL